MPAEIWPYVTVILYYRGFWSCKAMAQVLETVSHDRLTRMLNGDWSGHTLLDWSLRIVFCIGSRLVGGNLLLDDTIVEKPYSSSLLEASWTYSHSHKKVVSAFPSSSSSGKPRPCASLSASVFGRKRVLPKSLWLWICSVMRETSSTSNRILSFLTPGIRLDNFSNGLRCTGGILLARSKRIAVSTENR